MLDNLYAQATLSSDRRKASVSASQLEQKISSLPAPIDVYQALEKSPNIKLIAEIKRRSPSKGFLAEIPDAAKQGLIYQDAGAHAISVLTEESGFGGSLEDLVEVSKAVTIPTLRKDFISEEYQILEARAAGADFILLILSWLDKQSFQRLRDFAHEIGLSVLVETHTEDEIRIANQFGCELIGINTRNLNTFQTDIGLFEAMAKLIDGNAIAVAESSVKTFEDVVRYRNAGADVALVGEALVTGDPKTLIPRFISA